jgi:hypothetical protein
MKLNQAQANELSSLINSLMVNERLVQESKGEDFYYWVKHYNADADKLKEIGIDVVKYNLVKEEV